MSEMRIRLTGPQLNFLMHMLEINDPQAAAKKFVEILLEERLPPKEMSKVIDIIMVRMKEK